MLQFTHDELTGLSQSHLLELYPNHWVHKQAANAIKALQQAALMQGFDLRLASCYRSFTRQQMIWNNKVLGKQTCYDRNETPIDINLLSSFELANAICFFSAIPGSSRHHWGCDFDVYNAKSYSPPHRPQLTQAEYNPQGENYDMICWLQTNAHQFDIGFPYTADKDGVSAEPWHLSYLPISRIAEQQYSQARLKMILTQQTIMLSSTILENIDYFYNKYIGQYHV